MRLRKPLRTLVVVPPLLLSISLFFQTRTDAQEITVKSPSETMSSSSPMPVSVERIQRHFDKFPVIKEKRDLLRLNTYITVYARAPEINVLENYDLHMGPVQGAPTHNEMIKAMTPQKWQRSGIASFGF